ncbi:MAG: histidinol-phosphate aminotransferase [Cellvibrionaceae bacterium]
MNIIKPHLLAMSAYQPPLEKRDARKDLLLDFNERTIPISDTIVEALQTFISQGRLQQYPAYGGIVGRLAEYAGVSSNKLMITNGSDQGIDLIFRAVAKANAEAIIPGPAFAIYRQCAKVERMALIEPLYTRENGYPLAEVLQAIGENTAIVVISNPNNPSGTSVANDDIKTIAKAAPNAAILVDECYYEYSQNTCVELLTTCQNLFITRTFSKTWGIPSLRFGYLMAAAENIKALLNVRGPYDINQLAVVAANAALDNPDYTREYVKEVMQVSKPLLEQWLSQKNISFWPSQANYLWTFPENAEAIADHLAAEGILVRPKAYEQTLGLRITVGTQVQMQRLLEVWEKFTG